MQCPGCQGEVLGWHFYCPDCRTQLRWTTGASLTVYEIGKVEPSDPPPSRKLPVILTTVALSGVALAIIVTGVSISYRDANRHQSLTQNASMLTESVVRAESIANRPVARHATSVVAEQKLEEGTAPSLIPEQTQNKPERPLAKLEPSERDTQSNV